MGSIKNFVKKKSILDIFLIYGPLKNDKTI